MDKGEACDSLQKSDQMNQQRLSESNLRSIIQKLVSNGRLSIVSTIDGKFVLTQEQVKVEV